jgi:hypothetical protein
MLSDIIAHVQAVPAILWGNAVIVALVAVIVAAPLRSLFK